MNNRDDNPIPALVEVGSEPLLGSGFEGEQPDSDSALRRESFTSLLLTNQAPAKKLLKGERSRRAGKAGHRRHCCIPLRSRAVRFGI